MEREPNIHVGILSAPEIKVNLIKEYKCTDSGDIFHGPISFSATQDGRVEFQGRIVESVDLTPADADASFEVFDVTIGVNFHWQRKGTQRFPGKQTISLPRFQMTRLSVGTTERITSTSMCVPTITASVIRESPVRQPLL